MAPQGGSDPLDDVLRQVSRSFYLSLRILPGSLREPIGVAYLLARAADTVADTRVLPRAERLGHLEALRAAYAGASTDPAAIAHACKALQMTNVLRDVPRDLRAGRCYLPARELESLGVRPGDLLDPELALRARPLVRRLIALTLDHYDVAWRYTLAIPRAEWRMRLACAWPLLIGLRTPGRLARHPKPLRATAP